ncbi:MAG: sigma-70 family RNA polymerase sigma factor [Actinomycetota bacterium]
MNGVAEGAFRRHYGHVYRYLRRRVGDPERAADLTQDVFAAAAAALPAGTGEPPALAWLYTVAKRRFADEARRHGARERAIAGLSRAATRADEYGPSVTSALREALGRLPGGQRNVVVLKLLRGLSFAEIGAELGLTEDAAKMRFSRALRELRDDLTERGIEP